MISWKVGAVVVATLLTALLVRRFAPDKPGYTRRALAMLALFGVAYGGSFALARIGEDGWARTSAVVGDLLMTFLVIALIGVCLFEVALPRMRLRVTAIVADVTMGLAYVVATFLVLRHAGLELSGIITTSAVLTAVLAISLQATLGNIVGGMALQADDSIDVGDWIQLDNGKRGMVTKIGWRHTVLETNDWDTLIVPNATLLASTFTILGKRNGRRVPHRMWVHFNVDFRFTPSEVIRVVEEALCRAPIHGVASEPKPNCVCMNFAENGRDSMAYYAVRYWITDMRIDDPTNSRVRARIYGALKRADIPLAVPGAHLWIENDSEERRRRKVERARKRRMRALDALPFLAGIEESERERVADQLGYVPFVAGETVTQQGAVAHYLYIIVEGTAEVRVYSGNAYDVVSTVHGPTYVGEMGLMTGEPRMATVVATTDIECYRLDKHTFQQVIGAHPEMVEKISELLAQRKVELEAAQQELDQEQRDTHMAQEKSRLLGNIRGFFGLDR